MIKAICFDNFNTVYDTSTVEPEDIRNYLSQITLQTWRPLQLANSFRELIAFPDSAEGIHRLSEKYIVAALSNGPVELLLELAVKNDIEWTSIVPLEKYKVYKPNLLAYLTACAEFNVRPSEIMMVTANANFGDIEAAKELGMYWSLVRDVKCPTINDLAKRLGT